MSKPLLDKNIEIPDNSLKDLLTPSEFRMLKNRWRVIQYVEEGLTIRSIAEKVGVGTDTVVRTIRMMEKNGFRRKIKGDKKPLTQIKNHTPWIFGKK